MKREDIFTFLDEVNQIKHNESLTKLLRLNYGMSRELSQVYVAAWKEQRCPMN